MTDNNNKTNYQSNNTVNDKINTSVNIAAVQNLTGVITFDEGEGTPIENTVKGNWKSKAVLFIAGQTVSLFGSSLVQYAITWYITLFTGSGFYLTLAALCGFLPQVVISLFAGVWADRGSKKFLIIFADAVTALATLMLALLFLLGYRELWLIFLVMGIRSAGQGIQSPTVNAAIPEFIPKDKIIKVSGISTSLQYMLGIISPMASGALLLYMGLEYIFLIDVITAAIAVTFMLFIKFVKIPSQEKKNTFADLLQGLRYTRDNKFVLLIFVFYTIFGFLITPSVFLTPLMITRSYGGQVWQLTANEIAFGSGAVLGGLVIAKWGGFKNRIKTISLSCAVYGIFTVAGGIVKPICNIFPQGFLNPFYALLAVIFLLGLSMPFFNTTSTVFLQERVEGEKLGRVFGLMQITFAVSLPVGMLLFGPLAEIVSIELMLWITGILITLLGIAIYANKNLRNV